jgi:hypothetical protein
VFFPTEASKGKLGFGSAKGLEGNFHLGTVTTSVSSFPAGNVDLNASLPIAVSAPAVRSQAMISATRFGYRSARRLGARPTGAPSRST